MSVSLTVMTFNLHEDQAEDSPNSWVKRRDLCVSVISSYCPMILCTQQGLILFFFFVVFIEMFDLGLLCLFILEIGFCYFAFIFLSFFSGFWSGSLNSFPWCFMLFISCWHVVDYSGVKSQLDYLQQWLPGTFYFLDYLSFIDSKRSEVDISI